MRSLAPVAWTLLALSCIAQEDRPALTATVGPAGCRFVVPADMHADTAEWIGPCSAGMASGVGVVRAPKRNGTVELFYGEFKQGEAVRGMFGSSDGSLSYPTHSFDPRTHRRVEDNFTSTPAGQDVTLWTLASSAARIAARYYDGQGKKASANFYRAQARKLDRGPAE